MYRLLLFFLSLLCLQGCGDGKDHKGFIRIGWDADWFPLDFGAQNSYVNGFTEDLFLEIAARSDLQFEKIPANGDSLFDGLKQGKYEAVLSSFPPYSFNLAEYAFSELFLVTGLVLIVPNGSPYAKLEEMNQRSIGVIGSPPIEVLERENIAVQSFTSIPELLEAVVNGNVQGALLNRLPD